MTRSNTLAVYRLVLLLGLVMFIVVTQGPALLLRLEVARKLPRAWLKWCRNVIGMEVSVTGRPLVTGPALFVSNHISYLDVIALGSVVDGSFVSRADIRGWPIFGFLATLQRTIFIERNPRYARQQMDELMARLASGDRLMLFPEGTSSDGNTILPFKSSLFGAAELKAHGQPIPVQPISIAYTRLDGLPLGRLMRPTYAWYGDMDFAPHFWRLLGLGRFKVEVTLHEPVTIDAFGSRKALARHCETKVVGGFSQLLAGRPSEDRAPTLPASQVTDAPTTA